MKMKFLGATSTVTGSCYLIECGSKHVLLECGYYQGSPKCEALNTHPFPFDISKIDAVVLSHAHLDHSGRLPLLIKAGYRGPIYTHHATRDLCEILLYDAAHINVHDTEINNRKRRRKGLPEIIPLYVPADVEKTMHFFKGIEYNTTVQILPEISIRLYDAGHILGSALVEITLNEKGLQKKIVFSGDLGHRNAPILRDPEFITEADFVVMESTYGDRSHRSFEATWVELEEVLNDARKNKGNVLIPSFTIGRMQELLYIFNQHYQDWKMSDWRIFLDSPMGEKATITYEKHHDLYDEEASRLYQKEGGLFKLPNLYVTQSVEESMNINQFYSGAMIIAGSGMCTSGRIKHHLKHNIWRKDCHVIIVGYQAEGSLGRKLVDGAKEIILWGERIRVAAKIHTIGGLSAHADQQELLNWYGKFENHPPVALVHGEVRAKETLVEKLYERYTVHALTPKFRTSLDLRRLKS